MQKRRLPLLLLSLALLLNAGCTAVPATPQKDQTQLNQQQTTNADKTTTQPDAQQTIGAVAGLGDTEAAWETEFGHPFSQGDTIKIFKNNAYKVIFEKGRAVSITAAAINGADPLPVNSLPRDGILDSESSKTTGGMTMTVQKWHSALIETAIPETNGNYTIIKNQKGTAYDSIIIDCTPNLKK